MNSMWKEEIKVEVAILYVKVAVTPRLIQECIIYITFKNSLKMLKLIFILYI